MTRRTAIATPRRRKPQRDFCPLSGKVRFRDAREATKELHYLTNAAARADQAGGQHTIRVRRKYLCNVCRGWHLTSQEAWTGNGVGQRVRAPTPTLPAVPAPRRPAPVAAGLPSPLDRPGRERLGLAA